MPTTDRVHVVAGGEVLGKIAQKHGVTVAAIMAKNGIANANKIFPGQKLVIPGDGPAPAVSAASPVVAAPAPSATKPLKPLGELSKSFETSGKGPATVSGGQGDPGGVSYGSYQLATNMGTPKAFLASEGAHWVPEFGGAAPGTAAFSAVWKTIGVREPVAFHHAQHDFIQRTHFQVLVDKLIVLNGIDLNAPTHSHTLRDVAWSTAVQHGPGGGAKIFKTANDKVPINRDKPGYDKALIDAVYAERGRPGTTTALAHFTKVGANQIKGLKARFVNECVDAQAMLKAELAAGGPFAEPGDKPATVPAAAGTAPAAAAQAPAFPQPQPGIAAPVNTQLPVSGKGFVRYNPDANGSDRYGTTLFVKQIMQLAEAWSAQSQVPVSYGDMSRPGGASFQPTHKGHVRGDEVDIRPFRIDGKNEPMRWDIAGYDRDRTLAFLTLARQRHPAAVIFFNDRKLIEKGLCQALPKHDDHIHLRIR